MFAMHTKKARSLLIMLMIQQYSTTINLYPPKVSFWQNLGQMRFCPNVTVLNTLNLEFKLPSTYNRSGPGA